MTNCYFSKMAAIIYPTHMFCNMTLLLSRWCRAYFSTPSNPDGPMAALREHRVILLQAQPSTTQVVSTLSKHSLLGNISPVNHHIWQDDYSEMTVERSPGGQQTRMGPGSRGTRNAGKGAITEVDPPGPACATWKETMT